LIEERGWTVHEQWGSFDSIASLGDDAHNVAAKLDPSTLPLLLQQAAATVWNLVVSPNR
jgi:hypothetical protein